MEGGAEQRGDPNSSSLSSGSAHAQGEFVFVWFSSVRSRSGRSASGSAGDSDIVVCNIVVFGRRATLAVNIRTKFLGYVLSRSLVLSENYINMLTVIMDVNCAFVNAWLWNKIQGRC